MLGAWTSGSYRDLGDVDFELFWSPDGTMARLVVRSRSADHSLLLSTGEVDALRQFLAENVGED